MIQQMLPIWSLVPPPFLNLAWTSGSSWFLLKPGLENFEHYFAIVWDECNCAVVWGFFDVAFLWDWNENWPFPVLWPLLSFPNLLAYWLQYFQSIIFEDLKYSTGIPSPPLALFVVMLPKAHLTSHSRMSGSRWVITPSWLSGSQRSFLYSSSVYSCHLFLPSPTPLGHHRAPCRDGCVIQQLSNSYLFYTWWCVYVDATFSICPTLLCSLVCPLSVSIFLPCKQVHQHYFSRFSIYVLIYSICFFFFLLYFTWYNKL